MTATITISRRDNRGEDRDFIVDVTRDRDGDICAKCGEDVDELRTTNRFGSIESYPTGRLFQSKGDDIELNDEELEEAEQALTQLESLWQAERARLKEIFAPVAEPPFFNEPPTLSRESAGGSATPLVGANGRSEIAGPAPLPHHDLLNSRGLGISLPPGAPTATTLSPPTGAGTTESANAPSRPFLSSDLRLPLPDFAASPAPVENTRQP